MGGGAWEGVLEGAMGGVWGAVAGGGGGVREGWLVGGVQVGRFGGYMPPRPSVGPSQAPLTSLALPLTIPSPLSRLNIGTELVGEVTSAMNGEGHR